MKKPARLRHTNPRTCVSCLWYRVYEEGDDSGRGFSLWYCARDPENERDPGDLDQYHLVCDLFKKRS